MVSTMNESNPSGPGSAASLAAAVADRLLAKGWMLATAESCTGGLIAGACTDLSGSSNWFERGFVTYSNAAKTELLGVDAMLIEAQGAVARSHAQVAVSVTGVAGPTGGSVEKPVGTVWFGWSVGGQLRTEHRRFEGDRATVRAATVQHALQVLRDLLA